MQWHARIAYIKLYVSLVSVIAYATRPHLGKYVVFASHADGDITAIIRAYYVLSAVQSCAGLRHFLQDADIKITDGNCVVDIFSRRGFSIRHSKIDLLQEIELPDSRLNFGEIALGDIGRHIVELGPLQKPRPIVL